MSRAFYHTGFLSYLCDRITHKHERELLKSKIRDLSEEMVAIKQENMRLEERTEEQSIELGVTQGWLNEVKLENEGTDEVIKELTDFNSVANKTLNAYRELVLTIVLEKLKRLMDLNGSTTIYKFLDPFDAEGWCLDRACKSLITGDVYSYFYDKDNRGHFEFMNGYEMTYWREVMEFGDCKYEIQGMHEIVIGHKVDTQQAEYLEYKKELYKRAAIAIVKEQLDAIVLAHPNLLACLEENSIPSGFKSDGRMPE